jgi:hypothetical protein
MIRSGSISGLIFNNLKLADNITTVYLYKNIENLQLSYNENDKNLLGIITITKITPVEPIAILTPSNESTPLTNTNESIQQDPLKLINKTFTFNILPNENITMNNDFTANWKVISPKLNRSDKISIYSSDLTGTDIELFIELYVEYAK